MGTRSAFGTVTDGAFKGRYIHWDGYPTGVGKTLAQIIERDGVDEALKRITIDSYGWSSLNADFPELTPEIQAAIDEGKAAGKKAHDFEYGTPEGEWARLLVSGSGMGDGRFTGVAGYGVAYTTEQDQSSEDEWVEYTIGGTEDAWGTEWAYGIDRTDPRNPLFLIIKPQYSDVPHKIVQSLPLSEMVVDSDIWELAEKDDTDGD